MANETYDASSISWSKGAEAIRGNVALYLGATDTQAVVHLAKEVIGNSVDESASGFGSTIAVSYDSKSGAITVADHGRGIPVGTHPKYPEYDTLTLLATELHTGGKSKANNSGYSVGTIGCFVGSTRIQLYGRTSYRIDKLYSMYNKKNHDYIHAYTLIDGNITVKPIAAVHHTRDALTIAKVFIKGVKEPVECTPDHPFLTINGMVKAEDLQKGDKLLGNNVSVHGLFAPRDVKKVSIKTLKEPVPVYGLTIASSHLYMLDAGVFVGNTHGLGLAVVNALSLKMQIWTFRKNKWYYQAFTRGKPVKSRPTVVDGPPEVRGHTGACGTVIRFVPDLACFDEGSKMDMKPLSVWLNDLSWFITKNEIKRNKIVGRTPVKFVLTSKEGKEIIKSPGFFKYIEHTLATKKLEPIGDKPFVLQTTRVDVTIGWSSGDDDMVRGYTNGAYNANGGVHVKTLTDLIGKVFSRYAKKSQRYKVQDLIAGAVVLINIRLKSPRFDSQSKVRLVSEEAKNIVIEDVEQALIKWAKMHQKLVKELISRACSIASVTASMKNDRKLAAALKTKSRGKSVYPEGMLVSTTKDASSRELFLCEGNSAAGSAAKGSDRSFQEVLPLRGKIPNAMKGEEKAFASKIILDILRAVGYTPQTGVDGLRVGKIVLLTDADVDGSHISTLLMSLFQTILPELYEQGRVFIADTPLFIYNGANGKKTFAPTLEELTKKIGAKIDHTKITRAKGLGEVDAEVLHEVAFNPSTRTFIKLTPEDVKRRLGKVMGGDVQYRREMLGL